MRILPHDGILRKSAGRGIGHCQRARAEIEVVVFELQRPAAQERVFHAGADGPAAPAARSALIKNGSELGGLEIVGSGEGTPAFDIEQRRIECVPDPPCHRRQPGLPAPARIASVRAEGFVFQVAPGEIAFDAQHPFSELIIQSELTAHGRGIAGLRNCAAQKRPIAGGKSGSDMRAHVNASPIIRGLRNRGLARRDRNVSCRCAPCHEHDKDSACAQTLPHANLTGLQSSCPAPQRTRSSLAAGGLSASRADLASAVICE